LLEMGEPPEHRARTLSAWMSTPRMFDRAAANEAGSNETTAKRAVTNANNVAQGAQANAAQDRAAVIPTLKAEINNPTGYTAGAQNKMLTAAEAGGGGATSSLAGKVGLDALRTRNSGGTSALLDSIARAKAGAGAGASERVAADSSKLGEAKKQTALGGVQGMYGTDLSQQMKAMGLVPEDINAGTNAVNAQTTAGKSGWAQNLEQGIDTAATVYKALRPGGLPAGGGF